MNKLLSLRNILSWLVILSISPGVMGQSRKAKSSYSNQFTEVLQAACIQECHRKEEQLNEIIKDRVAFAPEEKSSLQINSELWMVNCLLKCAQEDSCK